MLWASRKKRSAKTTINRNFPVPNQYFKIREDFLKNLFRRADVHSQSPR